MEIDWLQEVEKRRDRIIRDTQEFLQIRSVLDEADSCEGSPFGPGVHQAMEYLLQRSEQAGFHTKRLDGYAAHTEYGSGEELLGILCHVDVVPEGEGWSSPPYAAEIRQGRIYARGAIDDKGPTMAAFYALLIVKELGLPLQKRVRLIIGGDEESHWRCMKHYFSSEEMPTLGFAPDADFPLIHAEKGILDAHVMTEKRETSAPPGGYKLASFHSGIRKNMVPEHAVARLQTDPENMAPLQQRFSAYRMENGLGGSAVLEDDLLVLETEGKSAHGMEPHAGINAGLSLAHFLAKESLDEQGTAFVSFLHSLCGDTSGNQLGIAVRDEISGPLTVNVGMMQYTEMPEQSPQRSIWLNIRYPVSTAYETLITTLKKKIEYCGAQLSDQQNKPPLHMDKSHHLVQTLLRVYSEQTGEEAEPLAIGGGTYARSLTSGVAFGPLFPGRPQVAHQKDEYIEIEDLLQATAIYAQAIYELCC